MEADAAPPGGPAPRERWFDRVHDAAVEAEFETGVREATVAEAERHVLWRLAGTVLGFVLIGLGIVALPLPGPGWLIIIVGLQLLPFSWAERTILLIRRRIPGVPEHGRIPVRTWLAMGVLVVTFSVIGMAWGDDLRQWVGDRWSERGQLFGTATLPA